MPLILYDMPRSGHAHRVRLLLSFLDVEYEQVMVDMMNGEHKTAEYLKLSPLGQVPTLVDDDTVITDSTAALVYLAKKYNATNWLPEDPAGAAAVQRWLSAASGELYRSVVQARAGRQFRREVDFERAEAEATRLFNWMQSELEEKTWWPPTTRRSRTSRCILTFVWRTKGNSIYQPIPPSIAGSPMSRIWIGLIQWRGSLKFRLGREEGAVFRG